MDLADPATTRPRRRDLRLLDNRRRTGADHRTRPPGTGTRARPRELSPAGSHIRGATLVPLGELAARAPELPKDKPIVAVCRAGSRSAHATAILQKAGIAEVANLPGGMLRWRAEGRGVEGGAL